MILTALKHIGEAIAEGEYIDKWDQYYSPAKMRNAETIVVLRVVEQSAGELAYDGSYLKDAGDPVEMAHELAYAYNHKRDKSLTQRVAGSPDKNVQYVLEWPTDESIGDASEADIITSLRQVFVKDYEDIVADVSTHFDGDGRLDPSSQEPVFITVEFRMSDGERMWPGDIQPIKEGIRNYYRDKAETMSAGSGNAGKTRCSVCDDVTEVYGAGTDMGGFFGLKKQGSFPEHNASEAWRHRPVCIDCITAIETAWDRFVTPQNYGAPGVRCRVFPYSLPVEGGLERLTALMNNARGDLLGTEGYSDEPSRPLTSAWDHYMREVDLDMEEDVLRLAFLHYEKNQTRSSGMSWIDGVSKPYIGKIEEESTSVVESPIFRDGILVGGPNSDIQIEPTEREIFTGMWAYSVLARESTRSGDDPEPAEDRFWLDVTQQLLTGCTIAYSALLSATADEICTRADRDLETEVEDGYYSPPLDTIHVAEVYHLIATLQQLELLADPDTVYSTSMDELQDEYASLEDAVEAFIAGHESIDSSPGREAAFIVGVLASQLSSWQQQRGLNRTFLQNVTLETVNVGSLPKLKNKIWEKAKTYNAQMGNYGVPWTGVHSMMDEALLAGEEAGWDATRDELQTFFAMGATIGPRLSSRVIQEDVVEGEEMEA